MTDELSEEISKLLGGADEPLETKEVIDGLEREGATRTKVIERLKNLRGDREIEGKRVGSGKGTWIWWK